MKLEPLVAKVEKQIQELSLGTGHGKVTLEITVRGGKPTGSKVIKEETDRIDEQ